MAGRQAGRVSLLITYITFPLGLRPAAAADAILRVQALLIIFLLLKCQLN